MQHQLLDLGLTKNFRVGDRVRVQLRVEALNATNYTLFNVGNMKPRSRITKYTKGAKYTKAAKPDKISWLSYISWLS